MSNVKQFTKQQLRDWQDYELIRMAGDWNMLDPNARIASGLTKDRYLFVLRHYGDLEQAVKKASKR